VYYYCVLIQHCICFPTD